MKQLTDEEKVLEYLLNKHRESGSTVVNFSKNELSTLKMNEKDVTRYLSILHATGKINITNKSIHGDLSRFWTMELLDGGINYFKDKKAKQASNRREWVRSYIPITISIISLIKSFMPEITSLMKSIMQLLK